MRHVSHASFAPGQAIGGGRSSDLIDTGFDDIAGGRVYLDREQVIEAWNALGMPSLQAFAGVVEERDRLQAELDQQTALNHDLLALAEEAESLRQAIAFTLERGCVVNPRTQAFGLRHKPSMKRIDLGKSLFPLRDGG